MNINCDIARDLIPLYRDGCLSEQSRRALRTHLAGCAGCRAYLGEYREHFAAAKTDAAAAPSGDFYKIAKRLRQRRTVTEIGVGAFIALLAGYAVFKTFKNNIEDAK